MGSCQWVSLEWSTTSVRHVIVSQLLATHRLQRLATLNPELVGQCWPRACPRELCLRVSQLTHALLRMPDRVCVYMQFDSLDVWFSQVTLAARVVVVSTTACFVSIDVLYRPVRHAGRASLRGLARATLWPPVGLQQPRIGCESNR